MSQEIKVTGMVLQAGNIGEYDKRIVLLNKRTWKDLGICKR